ncbi:MAG: Brp/Blh family beta-carotene 15,15'-dioxygenase [Flavobacteriales bacterium]|jgi:Brp/Blh family beta-carotene 15,15'-monooxygenase|tara:strand:- start:192 stop:1073 length:882 start_codon:yes stop_codon:yes gene_type:complete
MKYKEIAILITFFSLWLSVYFKGPIQELSALFLIFSLGIMHGSNDLFLISKFKTTSKPLKLVFFFSSYILTVLVASLLFYYIPIFALTGFIVFSAFHFGEQHWNDFTTKSLNFNRLLFLNYGLSVLFLLFALNSNATIEIIFALTGILINENWFSWIFFFNIILFVIQTLIMKYKTYITWQELMFELFLIIVFAIVFKTATLIWAFAIYFIFWHSIPSIFEQQSFLYGEVSFKTFIKYAKSSFLIWLISISSMLLLFIWLQDEVILLPLLFAFLGAITFAHSITIAKMFNSKK